MGKMAQNDTFEWFSPQILADLAGFGVDLGGGGPAGYNSWG